MADIGGTEASVNRALSCSSTRRTSWDTADRVRFSDTSVLYRRRLFWGGNGSGDAERFDDSRRGRDVCSGDSRMYGFSDGVRPEEGRLGMNRGG